MYVADLQHFVFWLINLNKQKGSKFENILQNSCNSYSPLYNRIEFTDGASKTNHLLFFFSMLNLHHVCILFPGSGIL
jgi:hypothetical protein